MKQLRRSEFNPYNLTQQVLLLGNITLFAGVVHLNIIYMGVLRQKRKIHLYSDSLMTNSCQREETEA